MHGWPTTRAHFTRSLRSTLCNMQTVCKLNDCLVQCVTPESKIKSAIVYSTTPYITREGNPVSQYSTVYAQTKPCNVWMDVQCILAQRLSKTLQRLYKSTNISQQVFVKCVSLCVCMWICKSSTGTLPPVSCLQKLQAPRQITSCFDARCNKGQKGLPIYSLLTCKKTSCYILFPLTYLTCHLMLFGRLELNKIFTGR